MCGNVRILAENVSFDNLLVGSGLFHGTKYCIDRLTSGTRRHRIKRTALSESNAAFYQVQITKWKFLRS